MQEKPLVFYISWFPLGIFNVCSTSFPNHEEWKETIFHSTSIPSKETTSLLLWLGTPLTCFLKMLNRFPFSTVPPSRNSILLG